ncbi:hypothetical protein [Methanobrevibacter sp.]|uniref:hypothetical protein n=1 Tax=Methanobrevibacter sp. TaxID=66852 RepID=UPI0025CF9B17|nr:hypothetical protein [Methanobrevibacter sp.]MBR4447127.1 hypothetical protein [Methanobrevibacter sp.]
MASKVNPTPTLKGLDAEKFIEKLNTPSSDEELKSLKKADEIYKKMEYIQK